MIEKRKGTYLQKALSLLLVLMLVMSCLAIAPGFGMTAEAAGTSITSMAYFSANDGPVLSKSGVSSASYGFVMPNFNGGAATWDDVVDDLTTNVKVNGVWTDIDDVPYFVYNSTWGHWSDGGVDGYWFVLEETTYIRLASAANPNVTLDYTLNFTALSSATITSMTATQGPALTAGVTGGTGFTWPVFNGDSAIKYEQVEDDLKVYVKTASNNTWVDIDDNAASGWIYDSNFGHFTDGGGGMWFTVTETTNVRLASISNPNVRIDYTITYEQPTRNSFTLSAPTTTFTAGVSGEIGMPLPLIDGGNAYQAELEAFVYQVKINNTWVNLGDFAASGFSYQGNGYDNMSDKNQWGFWVDGIYGLWFQPITENYQIRIGYPTNGVIGGSCGNNYVVYNFVGNPNAPRPDVSDLGNIEIGTSSNAAIPGWNMIFSDEFAGSALNTSKWQYNTGYYINEDPGTWGWGNNELEHYTSSTRNVNVGNGVLNLTAFKDPKTFPEIDPNRVAPYSSGKITTKDKFAFKYGRIDFRAKLPVGNGLWPALWMLPNDDTYGTWAASGELDVMEARGRVPNSTSGTLHFGGVWPNNRYIGDDYVFPEGQTFASDYHVYSVVWEEDNIKWYVDGVCFQKRVSSQWYSNGAANDDNAPFDQEFYIIMNLAVGGWFDNNITPDDSVLPASMNVDYVRVYQAVGDTSGSYTGRFDDNPTTTTTTTPTTTTTTTTAPTTTTTTAPPTGGKVHVEAENYTSMFGVDTEACSDTNGGRNVGWMEPGDWMRYSVNVPAAGTYRFVVRGARQDSGTSTLTLSKGTTSLGSASIAQTGGWQTWATYQSGTFNLAAGTQELTVNVTNGGCNLNWFELVPVSVPTTTTTTVPAVPSTVHVEAENYSSMYGVQKESCADTNGGENVGYMESGDWMKYSVNVPAAGTYKFVVRAARQESGTSALTLAKGATSLGSATIAQTGGWQTWSTYQSGTFTLAAGNQELTVNVTNGGCNLNWFELVPATAPTTTTTTTTRPTTTTTTTRPTTTTTTSRPTTTTTTTAPGGTTDAGVSRYSATQAQFFCNGYAWADVHYTVNGGGQINVRMTNNGANNTLVISGLKNGDVVSYSFTAGNTYAQDLTGFANYVHSGTTTTTTTTAPALSKIKVQAESYTSMSGVDTEVCTDNGGGRNVGWIDSGDWMKYSVNVPASGNYKLVVRGARPDAGSGSLSLKLGSTTLTTVAINQTGGWQTWSSFESGVFALSAGTRELTLSMGTSGFNLNWFELVPVISNIHIEAESYSSMLGVDTEACSDTNGGRNVGWMDAGDWMKYSVNVPVTGSYRLIARAARSDGGTSNITLAKGSSVLTTLALASTGGWQSWRSNTSGVFNLTAGTQELTINVINGGINLNWVELEYVG